MAEQEKEQGATVAGVWCGDRRPSPYPLFGNRRPSPYRSLARRTAALHRAANRSTAIGFRW